MEKREREREGRERERDREIVHYSDAEYFRWMLQ
jgi:hypothetical protein